MAFLVPLIFNKLGVSVAEEDMKNIITRCKSFYWQDNIRQLFNTLKSTAVLCQCRKKPITANDLQVFPSMFSPYDQPDDFEKQSDYQRINAAFYEDLDYNESIDLYDRAILNAAFKRHKTLSQIIERLNIPRSTLEARRKKYGLGEDRSL
jgi:DNA-binding NtrC family response regulator